VSEHITPIRVYVFIFLALMALTAVTVWVAFHDYGFWNDVIALAIAVLKSALVVLFFMQVYYSSRLSKLTVAGGLLWLLILIGITLSDYMSRGFLG
jgi:cytochrome c oxidase subunit 4